MAPRSTRRRKRTATTPCPFSETRSARRRWSTASPTPPRSTPTGASGNYFYPGDRALLRPGPDAFGETFGRGPTHRRGPAVERLVEFHLNGERIEPTGRAPIQFELHAEARNWEGLARLGGRGFLVATDTYPETLLAFVPAPTDSIWRGVMRTDAP